MMTRTKMRTVVTLVTALCVVSMFAGVGSAQLGILDQDVDAEVEETGGSGSGFLNLSAPGTGFLNGSSAVAGDVEEQEVDVELGGEGSAAGEEVAASIDCTISPEAAEGLTDACETAPLDVGGLTENPETNVALVEALAIGAIENPEAIPDLIDVLSLLGVPGVDMIPTEDIPFDAIPWDQIPTDQIPTDSIPSLAEEIPWDQIPDDQVPLTQDLDQMQAR